MEQIKKYVKKNRKWLTTSSIILIILIIPCFILIYSFSKARNAHPDFTRFDSPSVVEAFLLDELHPHQTTKKEFEQFIIKQNIWGCINHYSNVVLNIDNNDVDMIVICTVFAPADRNSEFIDGLISGLFTENNYLINFYFYEEILVDLDVDKVHKSF